MDSIGLGERLRYALSYLEKARVQAGNADLIRDAEARVARIREELRLEVEGHAGQLREALQEQQGLSARVTSGAVPPEKANARNRQLAAKIAELREDIGDLNVILAVKRSEELGGFADLPLEDYSQIASPPPPGIQWKPTRKGFVLWLVCLVVALVGVLAYEGMLPLGTHVSLEIMAADSADKTIGVTCRNTGPRPFTLYVPWPAEGLRKQQSVAASTLCGLAMYCRGEGEKEYKEIFVGPDCWSRAGMPLMEASPLPVDSYGSEILVMMLDKLKELGVKPIAIRFVLKRPNGRIIASCEKELDE